MAVFDGYDLQRISDDLRAMKPSEQSQTNQKFFDGDHWQMGQGWSGPMPSTTNEKYLEMVNDIKNGFLSKNIVKEVITRHTAGLVGKEPNWFFTPVRVLKPDETPNQEEENLISEADRILSDWWDQRKVLSIIKNAVTKLLWSGRSTVRIFIPKGQLDVAETEEGGRITFITPKKIEEALSVVFVESPNVDQAGIVTDLDSMERLSVFRWTINPKSGSEGEFYEVSFVNDEGFTVIKTLSRMSESADGFVAGATLDLDGELIVFEMQRDPLINEQARQNQKYFNLCLSMEQRNVILGGFMERVFLNVLPPGMYEDDPANPGQKIYKPLGTLNVGAGKTSLLTSQVYSDPATGQQTVLPASVFYKDPVPVQTFEDSMLRAYKNVLEECAQAHALITGDATVSAVSRVQARAEFMTSLLETKPEVDALIRWLLKVGLRMACLIAGEDPARFEAIQPMSNIRPNAGPLTPDEIRAIIEMYEKGVLSLESTMLMLGVDDADAEKAKIALEDKDLTYDRKIQLIIELGKLGFDIQDDQLEAIDKMLDPLIPKRDMEKRQLEKDQEQQTRLANATALGKLGDPVSGQDE